jgi:pyruvate formate lyase activating enzyme
LVHVEYLLDSMTAAREAGIATVLVSNGCAAEKPAEEVLTHTSAANIDLKSFSQDRYARVLGGKLEMVQDFIREAYGMGTHLELTTLIVPGLNDEPGELEEAAEFIAGISPEIPWHLTAYHPAYLWKRPAASAESVLKAARRVRKILSRVYTGNIPEAADRSFTDTRCPSCGALLVSRRDFWADPGGLVLKAEGGGKVYRCRRCEARAPFVY